MEVQKERQIELFKGDSYKFDDSIFRYLQLHTETHNYERPKALSRNTGSTFQILSSIQLKCYHHGVHADI